MCRSDRRNKERLALLVLLTLTRSSRRKVMLMVTLMPLRTNIILRISWLKKTHPSIVVNRVLFPLCILCLYLGHRLVSIWKSWPRWRNNSSACSLKATSTRTLRNVRTRPGCPSRSIISARRTLPRFTTRLKMLLMLLPSVCVIGSKRPRTLKLSKLART